MTLDISALMQPIVEIAKTAGGAIEPFFGKPELQQVHAKSDKTPVTKADIASHLVIQAALQALTPDIPLLSEEGESVDWAQRQHWPYVWIIDPLDGTRGFVEHSREFTVNIALVKGHQPVLGVIYAPMDQVCYYASAAGGAFKQVGDLAALSIRTQAMSQQQPRVITGRFHVQSPIPGLTVERIEMNSSWKLGVVAEGAADIYPRRGPTSEWDTAAGQCILEEAGGVVVDLNGQALQYNTKASMRNPEFLALGDPSQLTQILSLLKPTGEA